MSSGRWAGPRPEIDQSDIETLRNGITEQFPNLQFELSSLNGRPHIQGETDTWDTAVKVGHRLSDIWYKLGDDKEVIVDLTSRDAPETATTPPIGSFVSAVPDEADVVVIGAGIVGTIVAQKLAVLGNRVVLLESQLRAGTGATRLNNGMVHSGFDPKPGTLKGRLNVEGNRLWDKLASDLGIKLLRTGSTVVSLTADQDERIEEYYDRGAAKGVPVEIISGDELRKIEPRMSKNIKRALMTPTTGYIEAVEAAEKSVEILRHAGSNVFYGVTVTGFEKDENGVTGVDTNAGFIKTKLVINVAGLFADHVAALAGVRDFTLHARRGTLVIVRDDKDTPYRIGAGPVPSPYTKGGGVTLRPYGTLSLGPSAVEQPDRFHCVPTQEEIDWILEQSVLIYPEIDLSHVVEVEARPRASSFGEDFIIGPAAGLPGFYNVSGIQSPGVAASPAIANKVVDDLLQLGRITTNTTHYQEVWR